MSGPGKPHRGYPDIRLCVAAVAGALADLCEVVGTKAAKHTCYGHDVREHLVLWDVDHTLINAGGLSHQLYGAVFKQLFGRSLASVAPMAGRTDRAIILDTLTRAGVPDPAQHVCDFAAALAARAPAFGAHVRERGRALPGAAGVLRALAAMAAGRPLPALPGAAGNPGADRLGAAGHPGPQGPLVVQSVLTGNLRPLAEVKLGALGLDEYLDLDVGAYGDVHEIRAELVRVARDKAGAAYRAHFSGRATVLIGDTPFDVEAARATGARAVAVATGATAAAQLAAAGAHAVLPDLTDTTAVLAAIFA
jgi:phosphoglycolate phosphatase